ncbi:RelA/SpoT domain-containing protein [Desertimonas flava]|uniref:RelA/SpoT domain-containing protein n=1 Tax=Desertimonas flava TaxID=2064846 RepID=UPI000E34A3DE|nr:RelA/SpoT domain-containing protein [Desertimonas flava]
MARLDLRYSKGQVDRAGEIWRSYQFGDRQLDLMQVSESFDIVEHYRRCHQYPLTKATMGMRSSVQAEGIPVRVSQRLKRLNTILDKLLREPSMKLSRMQDIGGCRAVVPTIRDLRALQRRLEGRSGYVRSVDYVATPRSSGYRGVHVIVAYDGRTIEMQLRTVVMHEWAIAVERFGQRFGDLKSGAGPREVLDLLRVVSRANAIEESDEDVPDDILDEINALRSEVFGYIQRMEGQ